MNNSPSTIFHDAQTWLDNLYPKDGETRRTIKELNISSNEGSGYLNGSLSLEGFDNLEKFICRINYITNIDFSSLKNPEKLVHIDLASNFIEPQNLYCFSRFKNLEYLNIGSRFEEKIRRGIYNRFIGSLKPLMNLRKLRELHVEATDIYYGLEHLPDNLPAIFCFAFEGNTTLSEKIRITLDSYQGVYGEWKADHKNRDLIDKVKHIKSVIQTEIIAITEYDKINSERDNYRIERDNCIIERDHYRIERDNCIIERDNYKRERDNARSLSHRIKDPAMIIVAIIGLTGTVCSALIARFTK